MSALDEISEAYQDGYDDGRTLTKEERAVIRAALEWGKFFGLSNLSFMQARRLMRHPIDKRLAGPVAALFKLKSKRTNRGK